MVEYNISIYDHDASIRQSGQDTILRAALRSSVGYPYECNSGGCGSCKFELLEGEIENLWPDAPGLTPRDRRKNMHLACQARASSDLCIKVRTSTEYLAPVKPKRRMARYLGSADITHDIREFHFITAEAAEFSPGQFAMLDIPGVGTSRAYSMSNIANAEGEWHFQIRRLSNGKATGQLFDHLAPGAQVEIDTPYGLAWLREDNARDIVCVAGGSGLAPMISIARGASAAGMLETRKLHFFYGGRTPQDICGEALLRELPEYGQKIEYHGIVSQPEQMSGEVWNGEVGFVHELVQRDLNAKIRDYEFYFAGPPPMTQALQEMLMVKCQVPYTQIHFDRFF